MKAFGLKKQIAAKICGNIVFPLSVLTAAMACTPQAHIPDNVPQPDTTLATAGTLDLRRMEEVSDPLARLYLTAGPVAGITVAAPRNGETVFACGYGLGDVEMDVATNPETAYAPSSVTKQLAAAMVQLIEAGETSPDISIAQFLPDYPVQGHQVMVRHLQSHTSGITDCKIRNKVYLQRFRVDLSYEKLVEVFRKQPFDSKPRERFDHSNMSYKLLSKIIRRVTGTPYDDFIEHRLLQPLGRSMEHATTSRSR